MYLQNKQLLEITSRVSHGQSSQEIDSISRDVIQGLHKNFVCDNNDRIFCLHKNNMVPFRVNTVNFLCLAPKMKGSDVTLMLSIVKDL